MTKKNEPTTYTQDMQITIAKLEVMFDALSKQLAKVEQKLETGLVDVKKEIEGFESRMESKYVTKDEHNLVKNIVFGMVGMILIAFMGFLLSIAFKG